MDFDLSEVPSEPGHSCWSQLNFGGVLIDPDREASADNEDEGGNIWNDYQKREKISLAY